jgi:predicted O-methyltransferase YrrM
MNTTIRSVLDGLVPESFKHRLRVLKETRELKELPTAHCKADVLMPVRHIDVEKIFGSAAIESEWKTALKNIESLEIPGGTGGVNPGDRRAVFYLVRHFKPSSILEIGTHIGASTMHMAAALMVDRASDPKAGTLVSVDITNVNDPVSGPWVEYGLKRSPADAMKKLGCGDLVEFVTGTSLDHMSRSTRKYDFIFLDGDHAAKTVYREIPAALELLNQNGLILLHDYFPALNPLWSDGVVIPGPFLATEQLRMQGAKIQAVPLGGLPWSTKLGSRITSLALLGRGPN